MRCHAGTRRGKVCVVTGGASGIGLATCRRLAEEGGRVAVADIDLAAAERAAAELPGEAAAFPVDVTDDASVEPPCTQAVAERFGRIDVCHNNAGILLPDDTDPVATSLDTWHRHPRRQPDRRVPVPAPPDPPPAARPAAARSSTPPASWR